MIGGTDIIYPRRLSSDMLGFVLRSVCDDWPEAWVIIDNGVSSYERLTIADALVQTVGCPDEMMIYEDTEAWKSWESVGLTPKNGDQLLHILLGESATTFVVHHEPGTTQNMVKTIMEGLDRHFPKIIPRLRPRVMNGRSESTPRWAKPKAVRTLEEMLDEVQVDPLGHWPHIPKNWYSVSTGTYGDMAAFAHEDDAYRFRLNLINYWLNG